MKDRLREPSSWGGIGLIATGIASLLSHDYATGTAQIITGLMAVLRPGLLAVQNNMAEASQHIENGLSMAAIKTSPPVIVTGMTLMEYNYKTG